MSWTNIVGHEAAIRLIRGQLLKNRLAHTYLFVGPPGIGKRRLALELAKAVECESMGAEACDRCESCQRVEKGIFPDVMVVTSESQTGQLGIDQVRALAGWMALTPHTGRWKVGIVANADRLTEEAAHGCLKLLEEPPRQCLLLLTASAAYRLPSTLVSRCHLVRCVPQGIERVADYLEREGHLEPALARLLATWGCGRLGRALGFHRQERLAAKNGVLDQFLGASEQQALEIPFGNAPRSEVEEALEWIAAWWRDLLVLSLNGDPSWLIHQDRLKDLQTIVASRPLDATVRPEPFDSVRPELSRRTNGARDRLRNLDLLLDRIDRTYWVQEAVQRNASPRIALAALLSHGSGMHER